VRRFPPLALTTLVAATIAAFFIVQHLKVTTPFYSGSPSPAPSHINPIDGGVCKHKGIPTSFRRTRISFYLVNRSDHVNMYVVNSEDEVVAQVASDRYMPKLTRTNSKTVRRLFYWNGRASNGSVVPDGQYYFRVALINAARELDVGGPITVQTAAPHPVITKVTPSLIPEGTTPTTINFQGNEGFRSLVEIYRTDLSGPPKLVDAFETRRHPHDATWNGLLNGAPASAGTYLIGLSTTDRACTTTRFPVVVPPEPGTTPGAGVTVRYLAAQPPLAPVPAGSRALVYVDSRGRAYRWSLSLAGARAVIGNGNGQQVKLNVRLPGKVPGLYVLSIHSGPYRTAVPLVASVPRSAHPPRILVVLPALTWQGENPVDDVGSSPYDGDGLPNTLTAGVPIELDRVLANGLPAGIGDEAGLLAYLNKEHLDYDLSTDLGLIDAVGAPLTAYRAVVLAGSERWLPQSLSSALHTYVQHGGNVLSLGLDSLRRGVTVKDEDGQPEALNPTAPSPVDALGARPGTLVAHTNSLITVTRDQLGIFSATSGAFPGYGSYQPFTAVDAEGGPASEAGTTTGAPSVVGYRLGKGIVVEIGLVGFGSSLRYNVDAQELVSRLWQVLGH